MGSQIQEPLGATWNWGATSTPFQRSQQRAGNGQRKSSQAPWKDLESTSINLKNHRNRLSSVVFCKRKWIWLHKIIKMMKVIKKDAFVSKWTRGVLFYGQEKLWIWWWNRGFGVYWSLDGPRGGEWGQRARLSQECGVNFCGLVSSKFLHRWDVSSLLS